jgi:hypothetical protein
MGIVTQYYPSSNTVAMTIALASLATSSTLVAGRSSDAVDNTSALDLDHLLSGNIKLGTSPSANTRVEIWAYTPTKVVTGTPTWPGPLGGADADVTMASANQVANGCVLLKSLQADNVTGRDLPFDGISIASAFGGQLPPKYAIFVTHNTGVNLDSTSGNHWIHYQRIQGQVD